MQEKTLTNFQKHLVAMENAVASFEEGLDAQSDMQSARDNLREAIQSISEIHLDAKKPLSELISAVSEKNKGRREIAILMIRSLSLDGLLPFTTDHQLERKTVDLVVAGFGDQCRNLKLDEKRQTYEKINALKGFHENICTHINILRELPPTLSEIDGLREDIQRALRQGLSNSYFQPFNWVILKGKISLICEQISELVGCKDATYKSRFDHLTSNIVDLKDVIESFPSFLTSKYVLPFAIHIEHALLALKSEAVDQFTCNIESRRKPPHIAEKKYPLHLEDKFLTITIPMVNTGPGVAVDVAVELDCGRATSFALDTEEIRLGDIPPGEFAISFKAMIVEPANVVNMAMQVSWNELFGNTKSIALDVQLSAQDSTIDWSTLEQLDPYSLEVAEGDKFVGRKAKVQAIGNRLLKAQMTSTYITGQKRIGKTSLAQAVLSYIVTLAPPPVSYETFYLEWGEYCSADAASTLRSLGEQIHGFLHMHLPQTLDLQKPEFNGSIAPLNTVAKMLETTCPDKRFIIVLDEFDEIHPEMYRYGPIAEAFFANLRTLAARKNLAFILVGGEKMPFIIGAQGDQLNKFVREPLDYFSRSDEWNDYVDLVTSPVKNKLNWEDSALNELYSVTNGHPYYTKLLCSRIFSTAVAQRDTEIIASDIRYALNSHVSELDTNSFAHFWKDGINAERKEAEIIELKRLRVLVAYGRALRASTPSKQSISQHVSSALQQNEIGPLIEDFCRRDIMKEIGGDIEMQLPIFQKWIKDIGISKLIASTLADDLENELLKANDEAYVKAGEIESLVRIWPLYRGHEITGETVRAWLEQVKSPQDQRMLFTILQNMQFIKPQQISEYLQTAHSSKVARAIPPRIRDSKVDKRRDIIVTYLDGPGKSGSAYARSYAKENELLMECVIEPTKIQRRLNSESEAPNALVVVDDLAGTGKTIAESLNPLLLENSELLATRNIQLFVIVLFATEEAERKINLVLERFPQVDSKLHICEILTDQHRAFPKDSPGFWGDEQQRDRAKALCNTLGTGLYKEPLGYGSQALLITFPETCPNNCLPVIFASRSGAKSWVPLFPRPTS